MADKPTVSCSFDKAKHTEPLKTLFAEVLGPGAVEKPYSVLHDCLGGIFAFSLQRSKMSWSGSGFFPYGLGQWLCPADGSLLLIGLKFATIPGDSFADKYSAFLSYSPDDLTKHFQKSRFYAKIDVGGAAWCPPGYLHLLFPLSDGALWLKWTSFDAH